MSEQQQEFDATLLEQFQTFLKTQQEGDKSHTKKILNFQKGILQFSVEDKGITCPLQLSINENSNRIPQYSSRHNAPFSSNILGKELQLVDQEQEIWDSQSEYDYRTLRDKLNMKEIKNEIEKVLSDKSIVEYNIKSENPFSTGFKFDILNNDLCGYNNEVISTLFKSFSSEGVSGNVNQISDIRSLTGETEQDYQKARFINYVDAEQIEQDFLDLASQIDSFCLLDSEKSDFAALDHINKKKMYQSTIDQLDMARNLQDNKSNKLFDADKVISSLNSIYEDSKIQKKKTQLTMNKNKNYNEIIEQANKRLNFIESNDIYKEPQQEALSITTKVNPEEIFQKLVIKNETEDNSKFSSSTWAIEDKCEVNTFYDQLPKEKMAIQYPFELDNFQKRSLLRLEEGANVFVSAHTSAGKTVIAEYSIALAIKNKRKAIYTSPIKALSNQKYRDFRIKFGEDVGIITGDVSLNPTASCLIVTTEVLRNMLYKGHDMIRDIAWVIFDEVHYVNNQERGVVWEETIILLPESIGLVMLSATVPNYMNFANWVGRTKQRKIYVQRTLHRPVPLEHSISYEGKQFVIKAADSEFNSRVYDEIMDWVKKQENNKKNIKQVKDNFKGEKKEKEIFKNTNQSQSAKARDKLVNETYIKKTNKLNPSKGAGPMTDVQQLKQLLKQCQKNELLPCVVFVFSKNTIKNLSESLGSLNLVTHEESKQIEEFFNRASRKLKARDLEVHQIKTLKSLMIRGIAVHHGDVIPFLKEVVEILFSQGLIKVLFATETFAMGINMPTKTVIFYSVKKFDSQALRMLNSSEYTQMSGRAGRRGLDLKGNVIILISEIKKMPTKLDLSKMMDHKGEQLESKFKVNYELILKLLSSREIDVTEMIKKSYSENDKFSLLPIYLKRTQEVQKKLNSQSQITCHLKSITQDNIPIEEYFNVSKLLPTINEKYWSTEADYLMHDFKLPAYCEIMDSKYCTYLGIILDCVKQKGYTNYLIVLYVYDQNMQECDKPKFNFEQKCFFQDYAYQPFEKKKGKVSYIAEIIELPPSLITQIFDQGLNKQESVKYKPYQYNCADGVINMLNYYNRYRLIQNKRSQKQNQENNKVLNEFPHVDTASKKEDKELKNQLTEQYENSACNNCVKKADHFKQLVERENLKKELDSLVSQLDENDLSQQKNFQQRLTILRSLGYIDEENLPLLKARLAKELDNIYISEVIVRGILDELDEAEIAGILICFVSPQARKKEGGQEEYDPLDDGYSDKFNDSFLNIRQTVYNMIEQEMKLEILIGSSPDELIGEVFSPELMRVAYDWVKGKDFLHVSMLTEVQEGTIIRSMLRLDNLMKNIKSCVQYIGNNRLALKVESCQEKMRRDIIFAQSLYLEEDNK